MWILYLVIYSFLIGFYTIYRKKATERTNILFVLSLSSTIGFLLVSWSIVESFQISINNVSIIFVKALLISFGWIFELIALNKYYISSLQPISSIKVIITFIASILIFNESLYWWRFAGVVIIFLGLIILNQIDRIILKKHYKQEKIIKRIEKNDKIIIKFLSKLNYKNESKQIIKSRKFYQQTSKHNVFKREKMLAIMFFSFSCLFSSISTILDKFIIDKVSSNQMQFWYMFFLAILLWIYFLIVCLKEKKILIKKSDWKNYLIYIISIILIVADRLLFIALEEPNISMSGISILKQLSFIVSIILGGILYKEPGLKYKFIVIILILIGTVVVII